jgi:phage shock protein E
MKKPLVAIVGLISAALLLTACSSSSSVEKKNAAGFVEVINQADVVIIDVRTPAEFAEGHLPSALNIDFQSGNFEQEIESLDKTVTYAVYCRSGNRSSQATAIMAKAGFTNIYDLQGGVADLQAAGAQIVTN